MSITSDNGQRQPAHRRAQQMRSAWIASWLAVILLGWSALLSSCCTPQKAPTIVGRAQVLAVDNKAGTVTLTLALYRRMVLRLKDCSQKLKR